MFIIVYKYLHICLHIYKIYDITRNKRQFNSQIIPLLFILFLFLLLDAFARVIIGSKAADTRVIWETRSPTWDQMIIFNDIVIWGDVNTIALNPPTIVTEIFDKDIGVSETTDSRRQKVEGGMFVVECLVKSNSVNTRENKLYINNHTGFPFVSG